ncbi:MAG: hypothetical protein NC910_03945 [Candidatus Omnitrophica bacterium]|nr:hypothetical protein [Candidatus Omnitrophota bacterium]
MIDTNISFAGLARADGEADVVIRFGTLDRLPSAGRRRPYAVSFSGHEALIGWKGIGRFHVMGGRHVLVDSDPGVYPPLLQQVIVGSVMGIVLHQRRLLVLHASAVALGNEAVLFLGGKGWGKSTLAAFMVSKGADLVADDVAAVDWRDGRPVVLRGNLQLRLWPDALSALGESPAGFQKAVPSQEKRICPPRSFLERTFSPIRRIYLLQKSRRIRVEKIAAAGAAIELIRHSYRVEWLHDADPSVHFSRCTDLASSVAVRRLLRPLDFSRLDEIYSEVKTDCFEETAAGQVA